MKKIKLGTPVTDSITGLTGIAVARTEWLYGCMRIGVQSKKIKDDGTLNEPQWFDEAQLVEYKEPAKEKRSPGGPARSGECSKRSGEF